MKNMRTVLLMLFATISLSLSAQSVTLSGNVKDKTGEPVIGASVVEKGTTNGTITDFDGNFSLKVSGNKTLVVSYIGMKTMEKQVSAATRMNLKMESDAQTLGEVSVTAQAKRNNERYLSIFLYAGATPAKKSDLRQVPMSANWYW